MASLLFQVLAKYNIQVCNDFGQRHKNDVYDMHKEV